MRGLNTPALLQTHRKAKSLLGVQLTSPMQGFAICPKISVFWAPSLAMLQLTSSTGGSESGKA